MRWRFLLAAICKDRRNEHERIEPSSIDATRLQLRPLVVADAEALHLAYGDPEAMRFWDFPASVEVAQTAKRVEQSLSLSPERHAA